MTINGFLNIYSSKRDIYAYELVNPDTERLAIGTVTGDNVDTIDCRENLKWLVSRKELPIREFNRLVKNVPHLGCRWEEIRAKLQNLIEMERMESDEP